MRLSCLDALLVSCPTTRPATRWGGSTDTGDGPCIGSALDLGDPACPAPPGPADDCEDITDATLDVDPYVFAEELSSTQEAEIAAIIDADGNEYVATQIVDWEPRVQNDGTPAQCLVQKGVGLYRRAADADNFVRISANELDIPGVNQPLVWYTDPYLAVGTDTGAVYLSVLKWAPLEERSCTSGLVTPGDDIDEEVQLWMLAPGEAQLMKVAVGDDGFSSVISAGLNNQTPHTLDHPRVAAHSLDESTDRVVVTFNRFVPSSPDYFVTLDCTVPGTCSPAEDDFASGEQRQYSGAEITFSNPRFDEAGNLYIAHMFVGAPQVVRFEWGDTGWGDPVDSGQPTPAKDYFSFGQELSAPGGRGISIDTTPAIAVAQIGDTTEPVVWLAWVTHNPDNEDYGVELAAANGYHLSEGWTSTIEVPKLADPITLRGNEWAPELAVDGMRNSLDLVNYHSSASGLMSNLELESAIWPRITRFQADNLQFVAQASAIATPLVHAPQVGQLPARGPGTTDVFVGEYIGLAQRPSDGVGLVAWNLQREEDPDNGLARSDLAVSHFDSECAMGLVLDNGTFLSGEAVVTCADPASAEVSLETFGVTLAELCRSFPLCGQAENLFAAIEASILDPSTGLPELVASAVLEVRYGQIFQADGDSALLGEGLHDIQLCATELDPGITRELGCIEQPVRIMSGLGSGLDGFGHYAGPIALDYVSLTRQPGAMVLDVGDDGSETVRLPDSLGFTFYGEPVTEVVVGANGGLRFNAGTIAAQNAALPSLASSSPHVAVYWDDLDPSTGGSVASYFDGRRFIISWDAVPHASGLGEVSVQAHLYADGRMEFHLLDTEIGSMAFDFGGSATIGIQTQGDFVQVSYDDPTLLAAGLRALAFATDPCIASPLVIPAAVACTAPDIGLTVCAAHGQAVEIPPPDVSVCASDGEIIIGRVTHSGPTLALQIERAESLDIIDGQVMLDVGVHTIEWTVTNTDGVAIVPSFTQRVHVRDWVTALVCCDAGQTNFVLTDGDDIHIGSNAPECVMAGAGSDAIFTVGGGDTLAGQDGDDALSAGNTADVLVCGNGDDVAYGNNGSDLLTGGAGEDVLTGNADADDLDGGMDADVLHGNDGPDVVRGRAGDDVMMGGAGADQLYPGSGIDAVFGDHGSDSFYLLDLCELTHGKALFGGNGHDVLFVPPGVTTASLADAGVLVFEIEEIIINPTLPRYESDCVQ